MDRPIWGVHFEVSVGQVVTAPDISIATDKRGYPHNIFLISLQKHMLWYSLEAPRRGASIEYLQHMFS